MGKYELLRKYICLLGEIYKKPLVVKELYFSICEYFEVTFSPIDCPIKESSDIIEHRYDIKNLALLEQLGIITICAIKGGFIIRIHDDSFGKLVYQIEQGNIKE